MRRLLLIAALVAAFLLPAAPAALADTAPRAACGPEVTLTPPFGQAGTQVSVNLRHFPANQQYSVILRTPGDPVLGTGTTDGEGRSYFVFTMPAFTGDYVNIFVTTPPCNSAGAHFFFRATTPTPIPTPRPSPTPTVIATQTVPPVTPPSVPPVTPPPPPTVVVTPAAPPAGSGTEGFVGSTGFNVALVALSLMVFSSGFALLGSTRKRRAEAVPFIMHEAAGPAPDDDRR